MGIESRSDPSAAGNECISTLELWVQTETIGFPGFHLASLNEIIGYIASILLAAPSQCDFYALGIHIPHPRSCCSRCDDDHRSIIPIGAFVFELIFRIRQKSGAALASYTR